jgi:hypothetical protein
MSQPMLEERATALEQEAALHDPMHSHGIAFRFRASYRLANSDWSSRFIVPKTA